MRAFCLACFGVVFANFAYSETPELKKSVKLIDPETIEKYEKFKFTSGAFIKEKEEQTSFQFRAGFQVGDQGFPGFSTAQIKELTLPKVDVPFGLRLEGGSITNDDIEKLIYLKNLSLLEIRESLVTVQGLKELRHFKKLTHLTVSLANLDDDCLREIAKAPELRHLRIWGRKLTASGLKELAQCKKLESLEIPYSLQTGEVYQLLARLKMLHLLTVVRTKEGKQPTIPDEVYSFQHFNNEDKNEDAFRELARFENLTKLEIHSAYRRGFESLAGIENLKGLKFLYMEGGLRSADAVKSLAKLTQLQELSLSETVLRPDDMKEFNALENLESLSITGMRRFGLGDVNIDKQVLALKPNLKLKSLNLWGADLSKAGVDHLAKFENLETLIFEGADLKSADVTELAKLKKVKVLNMGRCQVTNGVFDTLEKMESLEFVGMMTNGVSDRGIEGFKKLKPKCEVHNKIYGIGK